MHQCLPKPNIEKHSSQIREAVLRNSGLETCAIQHAETGEATVRDDIQKVYRRAMQLSNASLRYEEANLAYERNPDKHSLEAIGILKKAIDIEDKYLIYKMKTLSLMMKQIMCL